MTKSSICLSIRDNALFSIESYGIKKLTCIVALVSKNKDGTKRIYFGSDRGIFFEDDKNEILEYHISTTPKIFKKSFNLGKNEMIIGVGGNSTDCDHIEHMDFSKLKITKKDEKSPAFFIKEKFIPYIKEKLSSTNIQAPDDMEIMIGLCGSVFFIDCSYAVMEVPSYGYSIGSASLPARAALMTLEKVNKDNRIKPISIIKTALQISESCSVTCKSPFDYLEI